MCPRRDKYKRICLGRMQTSVEQDGLSVGHTEKTQHWPPLLSLHSSHCSEMVAVPSHYLLRKKAPC